MERIFYDEEHEKYIKITQLENEYNELKANEDTEAETFRDYINNCMYWNNGTLREVNTMNVNKEKVQKYLTEIKKISGLEFHIALLIYDRLDVNEEDITDELVAKVGDLHNKYESIYNEELNYDLEYLMNGDD